MREYLIVNNLLLYKGNIRRLDANVNDFQDKNRHITMCSLNILQRYENQLKWFRLSTKQIVGFLTGSVPKPCIVPASTTVKLPHSSGHYSGNRHGHVTKTKTHRFQNFVAFRFLKCLLVSWHHLYIFSLYNSFKGISSLVNNMAKLLWEGQPRLTTVLASWSFDRVNLPIGTEALNTTCAWGI